MADVLPQPSSAFEISARELNLPVEQVVAVAELLDAGNTPAFITRFRRDVTGGLAESRILDIKRRVAMQRSLSERKAIILKSIETQGALSSDLAAAIQAAQTAKQVEDLYLPFKPRKQSLGQVARQRGLEPLASDIFVGVAPETDLATQATHYVRVDRGLNSLDEVFKGVGHLISERFADDIELRKKLRDLIWQDGQIVTKAIAANEDTDSSVDPTAELAVDAHPKVPAAEREPSIEKLATEPHATEPQATEPLATEPLATDDPPTDTAIIGSNESPASVSAPDVGMGEPAESAPSASSVLEVSVPEASVPEATDGNPPHSAAALSQAISAAAAHPERGTTDRRNQKKKKKKTVKEHDPFKHYADFSESVKRLPSHRILAINRAERSKRVRVKVRIDDAACQSIVHAMFPVEHPFAEFLGKCATDSLNRLILPSLEREVRRELTENAEQHALRVFGRNLRHLLLKPPVRSRRVLAIDPGFRYGCHTAALDEFGNPLGHAVFHLVGNDRRRSQSRRVLVDLIARHGCRMIAIGNGSACREAEQLVSDIINQELAGHNIEYVIVNEAGTNAYATSELGREELPNFDAAVRSAISIGRRLLDPLSELVKVDPAHLGIGLYQHDIKAKHLASELDDVVASCVNYVGVDVNRASPALLAFVSGLGKLTARRVYEYRLQHGPFKNRQEFKQVAGFGEQTFTQAAGFLRIVDGDNPLDSTSIHPESYQLAESILAKIGVKPQDLVPPKKQIEVPPIIVAAKPAEIHLPKAVPAAPEPSGTDSESIAVAPESNAPESKAPWVGAPVDSAVSPDPTMTAHDATAASDTQVALPPNAESSASPVATDAPIDSSMVASSTGSSGTPSSAAASETPSASAELNAASLPTAAVEAPVAEAPAPRIVEVIDTHVWNQQRKQLREALHGLDQASLAEELGANPVVIADLIQALSQIGVDPRERLPSVVSRRSILKIDDIEPNMHFRGQVVNVVDFGVFVDIGLGDSSLIHISRLSEGYVSDPHLMFAVGDSLDVWVAQVEKERRRVTLTAIRPGSQRGGRRPPRAERSHAERPRSAQPRPNRPRPTTAARPNVGERTPTGPRRGRSDGPAHRLPPKKIRKPPKPAPPITQEMIEGKTPMRSFSDLAQFFNKRGSDSDDANS